MSSQVEKRFQKRGCGKKQPSILEMLLLLSSKTRLFYSDSAEKSLLLSFRAKRKFISFKAVAYVCDYWCECASAIIFTWENFQVGHREIVKNRLLLLSHFPGFCALKVQRAQHLHGDFFNALFHRLERTILLLLRGSSIAEKSTSQICPDSVRLFSNAAACCLLTSSWHSCVFHHLTFRKNLPFFAISWTTVLGNCAAAFEQYWSLNS